MLRVTARLVLLQSLQTKKTGVATTTARLYHALLGDLATTASAGQELVALVYREPKPSNSRASAEVSDSDTEAGLDPQAESESECPLICVCLFFLVMLEMATTLVGSSPFIAIRCKLERKCACHTRRTNLRAVLAINSHHRQPKLD